MKHLKEFLPAFPRTPHLPHRPNVDAADVVATESEAAVIFSGACVQFEEKIDGASVGITIHEGHPVIRNRDHILNKAYTRKKNDTTAKMQFRPIWQWFYKHQKQFEAIVAQGSFSVYGEWMLAQHGILYTRLPDWFIAYDIYNWELDVWLEPRIARQMLSEAGFFLPTLLHRQIDNDIHNREEYSYEELDTLTQQNALWANEPMEGIYVKVSDGKVITHRFKHVRADYVRGKLWDNDKLKKNLLFKDT